MNRNNLNSDINRGHYFELLDRTHMASSYVQMALGDHPVLGKHPELQSLYEEAVERLGALYQAIGKIEETWA